jgi:hypothetical protein
MGAFAIELNVMIGAEVHGALPAAHDHAVRGSDLLNAFEHGDLVLEAYVPGEQGAGPVLVEDAWLIKCGDVMVDKCHHPLTLDELLYLPLPCLLAHYRPSRGVVPILVGKRNDYPAYTIRNVRPVY